MARLNSGTRIYGNATIDTFATISGNLNPIGGNVNIGSGGTVTAITRTAGGSGYATAPTVTISAPTTVGGVQATATCTITANVVDAAFTITNAGSGYVSQPTVTFSGGGGSGASAYAVVGAIPKIQALGNSLSIYSPTGEQLRIADRSGVTATSTRYVQVSGGVNGVTAPAIGTGGGSEAFDVYASGGFGIYLATNGIRTATQAVISHTPSAVNYVNLTGSTANNGVTISAQGTGTNLDVIVTPKGTGNLASTGNVSASGNVIGGNILTAGIMSSTGNAIHGNISVAGTISATGATNSTAFAVGNSAVSNVALGYFPTAGTAAEMAIRDYSTVASTMYFDNSVGSANINGQFQFRGSNSFTQWAKVDQYGINLPTRPAFRVYGSGTTAVTTTTNTNGVLNSNNWAVDYSQGSGLNGTTGIFTAPVAGLYSVHLVARVNNSSSAQIAIVKNYASTNLVQAMWECGINCTANHFGVSSIAKLAAGDTLVIKVTLGTITFDGNDSWAVAYIG